MISKIIKMLTLLSVVTVGTSLLMAADSTPSTSGTNVKKEIKAEKKEIKAEKKEVKKETKKETKKEIKKEVKKEMTKEEKKEEMERKTAPVTSTNKNLEKKAPDTKAPAK